jgi:hypothetical protein
MNSENLVSYDSLSPRQTDAMECRDSAESLNMPVVAVAAPPAGTGPRVCCRGCHGAPPLGGAVPRQDRQPLHHVRLGKKESVEDPNFTADRSLFCAILEQAVDDWRCLQRAGRIPAAAVSVTVESILEGRAQVSDMSHDEIESLLQLLTTPVLDRFCAHMAAVVKPTGIRRVLGIPEPRLLDLMSR